MRLNIMVLALLSSAVAAQAGSIDVIKTGQDASHSIERISCTTCATRAISKMQPAVELAPGTQKIEIREVDGVRKVFRTESWLGGSPVTYVSKALPDNAPMVAEEKSEKTDEVAAAPVTTSDQPVAATEADMIDEASKTSAVTADAGAEAKVDVTPKAAAFDPGKLELRLN